MFDFKNLEKVLDKVTSTLDLGTYADDFKKLSSIIYNKFFVILFSGVIINNLLCIYQKTFSVAFTPDEVDNTHNAWSVFNSLVIYKDFFDFKAPLYTFFNSFLISMADIPASFNTLVFLRLIHFFFICLAGILLYLVAKKMKLSTNASVFTVACFYMWDLLPGYGYEIRPGSLMLVFMLTGIYLFIANYTVSDNRLAFVSSGICFGLMFFFSFESVFFLIAFVIFAIVEFFTAEDRSGLNKFLTVLSGFLLVYAFVAVYFFLNNGFKDFHNLFFTYNFDFASIPVWTRQANITFIEQYFKNGDVYLCVLTLLGLTTYKFESFRGRLLFSILLITISAYVLITFYPTYALIFIPFCSMLIASFIDKFFFEKFYETNKFTLQKFVILCSLFLLFIGFSGNLLKYEDEPYMLDFERQRNNVNWVIKNVPRDEEVALSKLACPAYIFNKDIRYFKRPGYRESKYAGKELATDDLFATIEKKNPRYFFLYQNELEWTDSRVKDFLKENYGLLLINDYDQSNCIWIKKDSEKPSKIQVSN